MTNPCPPSPDTNWNTPLARGVREPLPNRRAGYTQRLRLGGYTVYLRTGEYADGRLGEVFIDVSKTGAALRSLLHGVAIAVSRALQCGTLLEEFVEAFRGFKFAPSGPVVGDPRIQEADSILDCVFHELELTYLRGELPLKLVDPDTLPPRVAGEHQSGGSSCV